MSANSIPAPGDSDGPNGRDDFIRFMRRVLLSNDLPPEDTAEGRATREFFRNNYDGFCNDLRHKTDRFELRPLTDSLHIFEFTAQLPYKRKLGAGAPVELMPGPIRGEVIYRSNLFAHLNEPAIAVRLEQTPGYFHPNYSRTRDLLCLGPIPNGPFELNLFIQSHLYPVITYQNVVVSDAFDIEAAAYFATAPDALSGLRPVPPLY